MKVAGDTIGRDSIDGTADCIEHDTCTVCIDCDEECEDRG